MANDTIIECRLIKQEAGSTHGTRWGDWDEKEEMDTFGYPISDNIIPSDEMDQLKI